MRTFKVFEHQTRGFEAVKIGFSWPCFFFGLIWALAKKLWALAAVVAGVTTIVTVLDLAIGSIAFSMLINLAFMAGWIALAFHGNQIRESVLYDRGYRLVTELQADSPADAITNAIRPGRARISPRGDGTAPEAEATS